MNTHRREIAAVVLVPLVLLALFVAGQSYGLLELYEDSARLVTWIRERGPWGPVAIIALQMGQVLLAPIPGQVVGIAAGHLFGTVLGTLYSLVGTAIGSWMAFVVARAYGRPLVQRLMPPAILARLDAGAQRHGLFFFALVFLLPFLPDDLACFAAGLTSIPIPALMAIAITARTPGILVSAWLGANVGGLSVHQWAMAIAAAMLVAILSLLYGEQLQQWLLARMVGEEDQIRSRPPSHEA